MPTKILQDGCPTRNQFAFDGTLAVAIYDLMFHDGNDVKPLSSIADQLTEPLNQAFAAQRFAGIAGDTRTVLQTAADPYFPVITDAIVEYPCASATFEVGDYVAACEVSAGTSLEKQKVKKTTDWRHAIGQVTKRYGSATTSVQFRLLAKVLTPVKTPPNAHMEAEAVQVATADTATLTIAQLLNKVLDATPTGAATYTLPTAELLVAGIPGAKVGDRFSFLINNKSGGANTVTVVAGTGGTADGTLTVAQHVIRPFHIIITNVTAAAEAYFVYGIG